MAVFFVRLRANGRNNSQQCWDLRCIVGRIQPVSLCKPCVMRVRGSNNVEKSFHRRKMSDWSIPDHVTQSKFNMAAKSSLVCLFQEKEEKLEPS